MKGLPIFWTAVFNIQYAEYADDDTLGFAKAKEALESLNQAYPGYSWAVKYQGGICFVRLLDEQLRLLFRGPVGFALKIKAFDHDAAVFKRKVVYVGGELLERCNLKRAEAEFGAEIEKMEGFERFERTH